MTELSISLNKTINAPIEKVFDAWLDAKTLSKFMTPMPGMPEPKTEADGREGGRFMILMMVDDQEVPHKGEYLEIKRPNKLVFTWESPFSTAGSTVTINFTAVDANRTALDFTHVKFPDEESRNNHEGGWAAILAKLNEVITTLAQGIHTEPA
ncbi:MAG: SRPBCC domain-containing protein [Gammaproteobacteria bacterium]|nr:SRPBCC domain-containing protein [Gammaproteobacteria bacterium]